MEQGQAIDHLEKASQFDAQAMQQKPNHMMILKKTFA